MRIARRSAGQRRGGHVPVSAGGDSVAGTTHRKPSRDASLADSLRWLRLASIRHGADGRGLLVPGAAASVPPGAKPHDRSAAFVPARCRARLSLRVKHLQRPRRADFENHIAAEHPDKWQPATLTVATRKKSFVARGLMRPAPPHTAHADEGTRAGGGGGKPLRSYRFSATKRPEMSRQKFNGFIRFHHSFILVHHDERNDFRCRSGVWRFLLLRRLFSFLLCGCRATPEVKHGKCRI